MNPSDIVIKVENLGKRYRIRHQQQERYTTLRDVIARGIRTRFHKVRKLDVNLSGPPLGDSTSGTRSSEGAIEDFWALKNVNFEVKRGEVIGIIGQNGAGKSTLLKVLSRITAPTTGEVQIRGRVASLLEVGTGFHPELTGRENIFLNGALLGMARAEIRSKFDEIVAFAEIEKFLDTPVKRYSSGMYVRLAFAVAAHLEPEILVVDEVLAVGDAQFQKKCLGRMNEVARGGRTVLFVSHNMIALRNLCNAGIWLEAGSIVATGNPSDLIHRYFKKNDDAGCERIWPHAAIAPGNESFRLMRAAACAADGSGRFTISKPFRLEFDYWNLVPSTRLNLSVYLLNEEGTAVFNTVPFTDAAWHGKAFPIGLFRSICEIPAHLLNDGSYRVRVMAVHNQAHVQFVSEELLSIDVSDDQPREGWQGKWQGAVRPLLKWTTEKIEERAVHNEPGRASIQAPS